MEGAGIEINENISSWKTVNGKPFITVSPSITADGSDFGAFTAGTTTSGIQEAIAALPVTGGIIYLLKGTFSVKGNTIVASSISNFSIVGSGKSTIITYSANTITNPDNTTTDIIVIADCTDFSISNFIIDGQRDTLAPINPITADASSGQATLTIAAGQGAKYIVGQHVSVYGGLFSNGGTQGKNIIGGDANFMDTGLMISAISAGGGSGGGDLITFTTNLSNTYTYGTGTLSDGYGPFAAVGGYITPYQQSVATNVAGRDLRGENQQNGLHLLNCQRFKISGITARNIWESGIKCGTGFISSSLTDACSEGSITDCNCYHGYDQGISIWLSERITVSNNILNATGWAGISFSASNRCVASSNVISNNYYRVPNDTNSGSGMAVEGGEGNVYTGNIIKNMWSDFMRLNQSPMNFGPNPSTPQYLGVGGVAAGTTAGTSILLNSTTNLTVNAPFCLVDQQRTEMVVIASIVDGTHVTFDRTTRFTHAANVALTIAIVTDNIVQNNIFDTTQVGGGIDLSGTARTLIKNNRFYSVGTFPATNLFAQTISMTENNIGGSANAVVGGEGSVIEGNIIGLSFNECIYFNNVQNITVRGNIMSICINGSNCVKEAGTGDYNRIEGNIIDSGVTNTVSIVGANTVLIENTAGMYSLDNGLMKFGGNGSSFTGFDVNGAGSIWYDTALNLRGGGTSINIQDAVNYVHLMTRYNNISTAGWGLSAVYATGNSYAQTGNVASVCTYTPSGEGTFKITGYINVTATAVGVAVNITYTDHNAIAQTDQPGLDREGVGLPVLTATAIDRYYFSYMVRATTATAVVVKTVGYVSGTYDITATIEQVA